MGWSEGPTQKVSILLKQAVEKLLYMCRWGQSGAETWVECHREGSLEATKIRVSRRRKGLFAKDSTL